MEPICIRTKVESDTLHLPQIQPLIGKVVDIVVVEIAPASREEVFAEAVHVPETAEERAAQQARFRQWRADPRYEHLWPVIERLIEAEEAPAAPEPSAPAAREAFYTAAGRIPETEAEWQSRRETLKGWRTDPRFESYWPVIDHMLAVDFASALRWAAAAEAVRGLTDYDFDAWREQREFDRLHAGDHLP